MTDRQAKTHEEIQTDLAAYALGSLDPAERAELEDHLRNCLECRTLLEDYEEVVGFYPLAAPVTQPPDGALGRLLDRARDESVEAPLPARVVDHRVHYLWAGFAALAALLLIMLGWNIWLQFSAGGDALVDSDNIAIVLPMTSSENTEGASGHLVMDAEWDDCALVASGLPALSEERDYQLWFVRADGTRESGAVFHPNDRGQITVEVEVPESWREFEQVGITEEPAGGSPSPTGPSVLVGNFAGGS
ncbi:MAG: anti-sigma factor [Thermomicrobiales bacterium]